MQPNQTSQESGAPSDGRIVPFEPPKHFKSRGEEITETIDRVRAVQCAGLEVVLVHRVRNEGTEKDLQPGKWCTGLEAVGRDRLSILDRDITCPICLEIIGQREAEKGEVSIESKADTVLEVDMTKEMRSELMDQIRMTHFDGGGGETLCGESQVDASMAATLRETSCPDCQNVAEELLVGIIQNGPGLSANEIGRVEYEVLIEGGVTALRDIAESLKTIVGIGKELSEAQDDPGE